MDYSHQVGFSSDPSYGTWLKGPAEQIIATMIIFLMIVPMIITALVTKLTLGSPVLFRQVRTGQNMEPFALHKFRTMHDTRDISGNLLPDKARDTKLTRFMRRIRVDEFPQLFSIVSGKMSFVGPRPLLPSTIQSMGELGKLRCQIRPGLTGWAQVNGNTRLSDADKLALDTWYVDHRSVRLDLIILFKTAATLVRGEQINQHQLANAKSYVADQYGAFALSNSGQLV